MKRKIRRKLASEKRKIERRLDRAVRFNEQGPVLQGAGIRYEVADKMSAIACGGIGAVHRMVRRLGLQKRIDDQVRLFKVHHPYFESDHVLNVAYNVVCGGRTLEDIETRRNDRVYLDALGAESIPDPTTTGDFCRRFSPSTVDALMEAVNDVRLDVWRSQDSTFFEQTARIDADGTLVTTDGECKEGMDISYKGDWGYHPLLVSIANTNEPLYIVNRSGNRPSHDGVAPYFDKAVSLCRRAGFKDVLLRGDTDFSLTSELDRWTDDGVRFVFGFNALEKVVLWAETAPDKLYAELVARAEREIKTKARARPKNIKQAIVRERGYVNLKLRAEDVIDFDYQPNKCKRTYRMIAVRKNISKERGDRPLFDEIRYHFYITNDWDLELHEVVQEARSRCNQENLIQQLKTGIRALHAPVNSLVANWAYMVMASLAWSLKAWFGLRIPVSPRWKAQHEEDRQVVLRMDFRTFQQRFIFVPAQIVRKARRLTYRLLGWNPTVGILMRFLDTA